LIIEKTIYIFHSLNLRDLKKKNFATNTKNFKIARYLEQVHKLESEEKKFLLLPTGDHIFEFDRYYVIYFL